MTDTNTNSVTKTEQDDNMKCPPGMKPGPDGKCIPAGEAYSTEEGNAGDSSSKGAPTLTDATTKANPADTHDCPPGSRWDGEKCVPSGDNAGQVGGGGAGSPTTPGKEAALEVQYKMIEKLMASHAVYNEKLLEAFKEYNLKTMKEILGAKGLPTYSKESAAFGVRKEAASSMVMDTSQMDDVYTKTVVNPAKFLEACNPYLRKESVSPDLAQGFTEWSIRPQAYLETLKKGWLNYSMSHAEHGKLEGTNNAKGEAFTISAGDMPQIFSKQVYLIPGGRMRVPIRQFLDTQIIENADRYNWYKVNGFAFDDVTNEGDAPTTEEAQTITKTTATPALIRANQTVKYADIENAPFDLIEAFNRAAALGSIDAEATDVLDTVYDAITPTNWISGDSTPVAITEDDTTSPGTMSQNSIYFGMSLVQNQGGDTSPGNMVLFIHPTPLYELMKEVTSQYWTGTSPTGGPPLMNTALGVIENRLGVDMVATNAVAAQDNTTNDTYRNVLAMKGSIGLAVAADIQIEAQRRPDLSAVKVGARHRLKGAVLDETMTCRISTSQ